MAEGCDNQICQEAWSGLDNGMKFIYENKPITTAMYFNMYTDVYNISTNSCRCANRYEKLYNYLKNFLIEYIRKFHQEITNYHDIEMVNNYCLAWKTFKSSSKTINGVFTYMSHHYCKDERNNVTRSIYDLTIICWKRELFDHFAIRLKDAFVKQIENERNGEDVTESPVRELLESYHKLLEIKNILTSYTKEGNLECFDEFLGSTFIEKTRIFYQTKAEHFLSSHSLIEYSKAVITWLNIEKGLVDRHFAPNIMDPLMKACIDVLVKNYVDRIREAFKASVEKYEINNVPFMFSFCEYASDNVNDMMKILQSRTEQKCSEVYPTTPDNGDLQTYINALLEIYDTYIDFKFDTGSRYTSQALNKAFTTLISKNSFIEAQSKSTVGILARYCDMLLRKPAKGSTKKNVEEGLNQVITIFKHIEDKDIFEKLYSRMLAKRLVHNLSASEDNELSMLEKLKYNCGFEYTRKLQRMYDDSIKSKDITQCFKKHIQEKQVDLKKIDMSVMVLTQSFWPFRYVNTCSIPPVLADIIGKFQGFYASKYTGRKLTFLHDMCCGELVCTHIPGKRYTVVASTCQMAILLLYNDADSYTPQKISESLDFKLDQLILNLQPLIETGILNVEGENLSTSIPANVSIALNMEFTSPKIRIDLSKAVIRNKVRTEKKDIQCEVENDRSIVIQAAIVRIMKMRKSLQQQALVSEVIKQLSVRFNPKIEMIKECIGILIEKGYLKRVEEKRDTYEYVS